MGGSSAPKSKPSQNSDDMQEPIPVVLDTAKMMPAPNARPTFNLLGASTKLGSDALGLQRGDILLAANTPPRMLEYNPTEVSQQAY
jgi:hypothetical protein